MELFLYSLLFGLGSCAKHYKLTLLYKACIGIALLLSFRFELLARVSRGVLLESISTTVSWYSKRAIE